MNWKNNRSWKVVFPEERFFLMREHSWSVVAWEIAKERGWIEENSTMFHIDNHMDDKYNGAIVPGVLEAASSKDLYPLVQEQWGHRERVGIDNYIWAGFARHSIQRVVFVCPKHKRAKDVNPFDFSLWKEKDLLALQAKIPEERVEAFRGKHFLSIPELREYVQQEGTLPYEGSHTAILSLDFDIFVEYEEHEKSIHDTRLKPESDIREQLHFLKHVYKWDAVTAAISPWYCGGDENADTILQLVLETFGLELAQGQDWSVLEK